MLFLSAYILTCFFVTIRELKTSFFFNFENPFKLFDFREFGNFITFPSARFDFKRDFLWQMMARNFIFRQNSIHWTPFCSILAKFSLFRQAISEIIKHDFRYPTTIFFSYILLRRRHISVTNKNSNIL